MHSCLSTVRNPPKSALLLLNQKNVVDMFGYAAYGVYMRIRYMITLKPPYTMFWSDGNVLMPVLKKERFRVVIHAMIKTDSVHRVILDLPALKTPIVCEPTRRPASSQGSKVSDHIRPSIFQSKDGQGEICRSVSTKAWKVSLELRDQTKLVTDGALEIGNIMFQSSGDNQLLTPENVNPIFPNSKVF